jgi:hypothetical protein
LANGKHVLILPNPHGAFVLTMSISIIQNMTDKTIELRGDCGGNNSVFFNCLYLATCSQRVQIGFGKCTLEILRYLIQKTRTNHMKLPAKPLKTMSHS